MCVGLRRKRVVTWLLGPGEETGVARAEGDETCQKGGPTYEQQCPVCPERWATAMPITGGIRGRLGDAAAASHMVSGISVRSPSRCSLSPLSRAQMFPDSRCSLYSQTVVSRLLRGTTLLWSRNCSFHPPLTRAQQIHFTHAGCQLSKGRFQKKQISLLKKLSNCA